MPSKKKSKPKKIWPNIALAIGTIIVLLILMEFAIRAAVPYSSLFAYSEEMDYVMKPNKQINFNTLEFETVIKTNELGLRDSQYQEKGDEETILILGDSFAFGYGVNQEDSYAQLWQDRLNLDIINSGIPGYDTQRELAYLREEGIQLNPDHISLHFVMNDPFSNSGEYEFAPFPKNPILRYLPFNALGFFYNKVKDIKYTLIKLGVEVETQSSDQELIRDGSLLLTKKPPSFVNQSWILTLNLIQEIHNLAKSNDASFSLVIIPLKQHLHPEIKYSEDQINNLDFDRHRNLITKLGEKLEFEVIDLTDDLRKHPVEEVYYQVDRHFTPKGHEIVADILTERFINYQDSTVGNG